MKKKIIISTSISIFTLVLFFLPYDISLFNICDLHKYFTFYGHDQTFIQYELPILIQRVVTISCVYFLLSAMLIISLFFKKKLLYIFFTTLPLVGFFILYTVYTYFACKGTLSQITPSWSFYLSLLLLLGWIAYIFSPKWLPPLKKAFAGFRSTHPSKAEKIAELEREVEELKNQDESKDIASDIEKGSD